MGTDAHANRRPERRRRCRLKPAGARRPVNSVTRAPRPRLNILGRATRTKRIFARLRGGWAYDERPLQSPRGRILSDCGRCAARAITCETKACEAEAHHRPGGKLGNHGGHADVVDAYSARCVQFPDLERRA